MTLVLQVDLEEAKRICRTLLRARIGGVRQDLMRRLPVWNHARFVSESADVERKYETGDLARTIEAAQRLTDLAEASGDAYPEAIHDRGVAWLRLGRMLKEACRSKEALSALEKARERFSVLAKAGDPAAARNEITIITDKGDVLLTLGRFDEAAASYEDGIQRATALGYVRGVGVGEVQLGMARHNQGRLEEALSAYEKARGTFEALGEPRVVATVWHQIGAIHRESGSFEAAERAYKTSVAVSTAQGDRVGEARTLYSLAALYRDQHRLEDAAALFQQSAHLKRSLGDRLGESGSLTARGVALRTLRQFEEARQALTASLALQDAYGHHAEPWKTWAALEGVERDAGQPEAALEARRKALRAYRAYRADGGEPKDSATRFIVVFGQTLRASGPDDARALLPDLADVSDEFAPTLRALQAIAAGSRDAALADDPAHHPTGAVELALLLESLPAAAPPPAHLTIAAPCPCGSGKPFPLCHGAPEPNAG
jgi:tetratricopeptide (TPR) repeat protein